MFIGSQTLTRLKRHLNSFPAMVKIIKAKREAKFAFSRLDTPPILLYQMGKVGSSTVYKSLQDTTLSNPVLHLHFLSHDLPNRRKSHTQAGIYPPPYHIYLGEAMSKALNKNRDYPIKIISLVRDPIALTISDLFQNPHYAREVINTDGKTIDPQKAADYLNHELHNPKTFSYIFEWFDRELKSVFDIDVFAKPFPVETGYGVYSKDKVEALIIRLEDLAEKGPEAISEFLSLSDPLILRQSNVRNKSKDNKAYQTVLNRICLSPSLCREIYSSRFVKHFYSETTINKFISKWTTNSSNYGC